ncbi:MAG TPA: hypothetical protein VGM51_03365 [Armatimonadota bacterium]|jgi:hypothetical protein
MCRSVLRLGVLSAFILAVCAAVPAAVINFDDLPANGHGSGLAVPVTTQYSSLGVTFNSPTVFDYTKPTPILNFAHSGNNAIEQCYGAEFCTTPIQANFTTGQARVGVWVGCSGALAASQNVTLKGFNQFGDLVATASATLSASTGPTLIRTNLVISTINPVIRMVQVAFDPSTLDMNGLAVDDLEFDTIGPPPPCTATAFPSVSLLNPAPGATVRCNRFLLEDNATSDDPAAMRTISIYGPSGGGPYWVTTFTGSSRLGPTWIYEALTPGVNTILDEVRDCKSTAQASRTITYSPIPNTVRVTVLGGEVTQTIQDMNHHVPLIAGKRTVLRVYLRLDGATSLANISGHVYANRPGAPDYLFLGPGIPPYNLASSNRITLNSTATLDSLRRDATASLNFDLPPEWTTEGRVHISLQDANTDDCEGSLAIKGDLFEETGSGFFIYANFVTAPTVRIRAISVPYMPNGTTTVFAPTQTDFDHLSSWLRRAYPTANVSFLQGVLGVRNGAPGNFDADDINSQLQDVRSMETSGNGAVDSHTHYYGMVADGGGFMRGKADGIPSKVASGPTGPNWGWDTDGSYGDWYGGHEIGHTFGRFHAKYCGANECFTFIWTFCPSGYVAYPYPNGLLDGPNYFSLFGYDVGDPSLSIAPAVYPSDIWTDVMTYCDREWMSDFTYSGILNRLRAENPSAGPVPRSMAAGDWLLVSATMNLTKETAVLRPFWRLPWLAARRSPDVSHYYIVMVNRLGTVLARYRFEPMVDTEAVSGDDFHASMSEVVPWAEGTGRILILRDDVVLASREVSRSVPQVRVIYPNGGECLGCVNSAIATVTWTATDADADSLTYALHYSTDGGVTWRVVDSSITATSYEVNTDTLPGSATALFRVIATDGVNTAWDDSDSVFTIRVKAPNVHITTPGNGASFTTDQTVALNGEAIDLQDGDLSGASLVWQSSAVATPIGTGGSSSASLPPGDQTVTLEATNIAGLKGSASVVLNIRPAVLVADAGPDHAVAVFVPAMLNGTASHGVGALAYLWVFVYKPEGSQAVLSGATTSTPSFTPDLPGTYLVQLIVADRGSQTATTRVTLIAEGMIEVLRIAGGLAGTNPDIVAYLDAVNTGSSAGRIDILDAVRLARSALIPHAGSGAVTRNVTNRFSWFGVFIDDPRLNNWADAHLVATHRFVGAYNGPTAVWYSPNDHKWVIANDDAGIMADGETFNYSFGPQVHTVTRSAESSPFPWGVLLAAPELNHNGSANVLATHHFVSTFGSTALGVRYDGSSWSAYSENASDMLNGERYFYVDADGSGGRAVHSAGNDYHGYGLYLDDARLNGNPSAILLAQHDGIYSVNPSPMGVWYDGSRWVVYNETRAQFPMGEAVNYLIGQ